jgi:serine protease Do
VTVGIISGIGRDNRELESQQFQKFLQTDAAINPGNSGGPLVNIRGELIGINTAIVSRSGGYEGLGFALASNIAVKVYNEIIQHGRVTRGSIGITFSEQKPALLRVYGAGKGGVLVGVVKEGGPAAKAGMKPEDVITEINGKPITSGDALVATVADTPVGETVPIVVLRDGKKLTLNVRIADRSELFGEELGLTPGPSEQEAEEAEVMFGISVSNLTASQREQLELQEPGGVLVTDVEPASFADDIGLNENDVILEINRQPVSNIGEISAIQSKLKPGDDVALKILRRAPGGRSWTTAYLAGVLPRAGSERF